MAAVPEPGVSRFAGGFADGFVGSVDAGGDDADQNEGSSLFGS